MQDPLTWLLAAGNRGLPALVLLWLAWVFGSTLRRGSTPLIERIARRGSSALSPALCRYTRRLTLLWCAYFVLSSFVSLVVPARHAVVGLAIWSASAALFVGERWLRSRLFPHEVFPGLVQQLRDTWSVWRTRG